MHSARLRTKAMRPPLPGQCEQVSAEHEEDRHPQATERVETGQACKGLTLGLTAYWVRMTEQNEPGGQQPHHIEAGIACGVVWLR